MGRDDALAAVTAALDAGSALVLIEGEPGIGKTRLVREALAHLASSAPADGPGYRVLLTGCPPLSEPLPLGAVVDGVRRLGKQIGGIGDLELSKLGGALRPLFPEWADELPPPLEELDDPKETRHRLFSALTELIDRLGVGVLVVEDLHWADTPTLEWLLTLTTAEPVPDGHEMSIVVSYRPADVPEGSLLRRLISRAPTGLTMLRVDLEPLDVAATQRLVASMFGTDGVSTEFAEFLHQRTDGVPLAIEECVLLLRDRHDIVRRGPAWIRRMLGELKVPAAVRDSVLERVERLDPDTRQILHAAAILGEPADEAILAAVAELDEETIRRGVALGLDSGLLLESAPGRYELRHALDAQAIAEAIPVSERRRLHQRAGEALRTLDHSPVAALARHFREAGEVEAWARYAEASAELALQSGDDYTAVTVLYDLLTSAHHPGKRRGRLARRLGEAAASGTARLADLAEPVVQALRRVVSDGDIPRGERGAIRLLLGRLLRWYGPPEAADREIEAALEDLGDRPELACRAMMNLGAALSRDWPVRQHLEWIERASALVPRVEVAAERRRVAAIRAAALLALGEQEGWQAAAELPQVGSDLSEQRTILLSTIDIGRLAIWWGRYAEARTRLSKATESTVAADYERAASAARTASGYLDWYTGRWAGLADSIAQLAEIDTTEQSGIRNEAREITGLLALAAGNRGIAERHLTKALNAYSCDGPLDYRAAFTTAGLGRLRLTEGAADEALRVTEPVIAWIARKELWLWATDAISVHVDALTSVGDIAQAEELAERFDDWQSGRHAPAPAAASLLCQSILAQARGDLDKAAQLYAQAASAWAALPRPYDELLTLERQGRCLLAADETDQALAILTEAQQRLHDLGAQWDADRIAQPLRQQEAANGRRRPGRHRDRLSPRELKVVALVAQGMTNRQAGQVLFLSPKTIEYYLRNAMRKLGVSTRTGAAMAAAEAGLISSASQEPVPTSANG